MVHRGLWHRAGGGAGRAMGSRTTRGSVDAFSRARVLPEGEWALFTEGLESLKDRVEEEIEYGENLFPTRVPVFDVLTPEQKLGLLADVARALRDPAVPFPDHTAANEGAIAAVFDV